MGNWLTFKTSREYRIIYIKHKGDFYPLVWPDTYVEFLLFLKQNFDFSPRDGVPSSSTSALKQASDLKESSDSKNINSFKLGSLTFLDGTGRQVRVSSEETFKGLVPCLKINRAIDTNKDNNQSNIDVFFVSIAIPQ